MLKKIDQAVASIKGKTNNTPKIGLVLGSGLGSLADKIKSPIIINYEDIPFFTTSTVEGHEGRLVIGQLEGKCVIAMQGRLHYYEGYTPQEITFPIRVMKGLGVEKLIVTNAAGGLREDLKPGSLMLIKDHINIMIPNPLIGSNYKELGVRFPDMSKAYNEDLLKLARKVAKEEGIELKEGIYSPISGPSYSTKAELRMLIKLGSDAVGMSTAPEVVVANHSNIDVLGITCITDNANPDNMDGPSHEEIVKVANKTRPLFEKLIKKIIKQIKA